jgi:hypothetical protein
MMEGFLSESEDFSLNDAAAAKAIRGRVADRSIGRVGSPAVSPTWKVTQGLVEHLPQIIKLMN